jgi:hypothetical protein
MLHKIHVIGYVGNVRESILIKPPHLIMLYMPHSFTGRLMLGAEQTGETEYLWVESVLSVLSVLSSGKVVSKHYVYYNYFHKVPVILSHDIQCESLTTRQIYITRDRRNGIFLGC